MPWDQDLPSRWNLAAVLRPNWADASSRASNVSSFDRPALLRAAQDEPLEDLFSGYHYSGKGNAAVAGAIRERLFPSGP